MTIHVPYWSAPAAAGIPQEDPGVVSSGTLRNIKTP